MIGIRESNFDIAKIEKKHLDFVSNRVQRVIAFYIQVFNLLDSLSRNSGITNKIIISEIQNAKTDLSLDDYKALLNSLLTKNMIGKMENVIVLKRPKCRNPQINDVSAIIIALNDLNRNYQSILKLDVSIATPATIKRYKNLERKLIPIFFLLPKIFDYDTWFSKIDTDGVWGPYQLTQALGLSTCPYCNRQYTITIIKIDGKKVARPQLDHFLPKSNYPLLALSFFNLIPSCSSCNSSIKGFSAIDFKSHLNPYSNNVKHGLFRFDYTPQSYEASIGASNKLKVEVKYDGPKTDLELMKKVEANIKLFCLNDVYEKHSEEVQEIIWKRTMSNDKYLQLLQNTFQTLNLSAEDCFRFGFGTFFDERDFHKRPLSKLVKDIAIEIGALKKYPKNS